MSVELDTEGIFTHADQVAGCAIVFLNFPLELRSPPGVGIKPDVVSVRIGYVATVGNRLKRRISKTDQYREIGLRAGNLGMIDRQGPLTCYSHWAALD